MSKRKVERFAFVHPFYYLLFVINIVFNYYRFFCLAYKLVFPFKGYKTAYVYHATAIIVCNCLKSIKLNYNLSNGKMFVVENELTINPSEYGIQSFCQSTKTKLRLVQLIATVLTLRAENRIKYQKQKANACIQSTYKDIGKKQNIRIFRKD